MLGRVKTHTQSTVITSTYEINIVLLIMVLYYYSFNFLTPISNTELTQYYYLNGFFGAR